MAGEGGNCPPPPRLPDYPPYNHTLYICRPVKGPLYEGGRSSLKKREIESEKEGDCLKMREIA